MNNHLDTLLATVGVNGLHFHCAHDQDGYSIEVSENRSASGSLRYVGPADEAWEFVKRSIGGWGVLSGVPAYFAAYTHPRNPSMPCSSASIQYFGVMTPDPNRAGEFKYPYCHVTLGFKTETHETSGSDAYRTINVKSNPQVIEIEGGVATFASGQRTSAPIPIPFTEIEIRVEMPKARSEGDHILDLVNKINNAPFQGKATGTVRLADYSYDRTDKGVDEAPEFRRSYAFSYKPIGQNKEFNPHTGTFEDVTIGLTGTKKKFDSASFATMFD